MVVWRFELHKGYRGCRGCESWAGVWPPLDGRPALATYRMNFAGPALTTDINGYYETQRPPNVGEITGCGESWAR